MSKKRLLLASAILSVATLAASCGGGGGGTASATTTPPPSTTTTPPPPQAKALATALVQSTDLTSTVFQRHLVTIKSDGTADVEALSGDSGGPGQLTFLYQCPNNKVFLAGGGNIHMYDPATKAITKVTTVTIAGNYVFAGGNANFFLANDPAAPAPAEVIVTCNGQAVEFNALSSVGDVVAIKNNYAIYVDNAGAGAKDSVFIVDTNGNKAQVIQTAVAGTAGLDFAIAANGQSYVIADTVTNQANALNVPVVLINSVGQPSVFQTNLVKNAGAPADAIDPTSLVIAEVGTTVFAGVGLTADQAAVSDVAWFRSQGLTEVQVNCKGGPVAGAGAGIVAMDGQGNLYCTSETAANQLKGVMADGTPMGDSAVGAAGAIGPAIPRFSLSNGIIFVTGGTVHSATPGATVNLANPAPSPAVVANINTYCVGGAPSLQGTPNFHCTIGNNPTFAVFPDVNNTITVTIPGTANVTYTAVFWGNNFIVQDNANSRLFRCTANAFNTQCVLLTSIPTPGTVVGAPNEIANRRRAGGAIRLYASSTPYQVDLANDTYKTYPIVFPFIPNGGHFSNDHSITVAPSNAGTSNCTLPNLFSSLTLAQLGQSSSVPVSSPIFGTGNFSSRCLFGGQPVLGVFPQ